MFKNQNTSPAEAQYTVRYISALLQTAIDQRVSDIHFDSFGHEVVVRFRMDGNLKVHEILGPALYPSIVARVKTMAQMDISQTLRPQDGRLQFMSTQAYHIRIHTCPTLHQEKMVLRFLGDAHRVFRLSDLGMTGEQLSQLARVLNQAQGLILCTGPTGSGKSMTLYALLKYLQSKSLSITTIEDPVEIPMPGISQIPIQPKQGMDTVSILKSVLRQDPDVIMLGEIRDEDSAHMAVRAALTGHLVLTTLHTRDTPSAVTRLLNMGIAAYDLADALMLVMAQRLVRMREGRGKGRMGLFELLPIDHAEKQAILSRHPLRATFTLADAYQYHLKSGTVLPGENLA